MKRMQVMSALATVALAILVMPGELSATDSAKVADLSYKCSSGKQGACRDLAKIALNELDPGVRGSAVLSLTDQSVLAKVAIEDKDSQVRYFAVSKLKDQSLLAKIAVDDTDSSVRHAALSALGKHMIEAADRGDAAAVQSYLDQGVSVDLTDEAHFTALMRASMNGHIEVVRVLLAKGANVNASAFDSDYVQMSNGAKAYPGVTTTATWIASQTGGVVVHGNKNTALSLATANGHQEIRELLIKAGAR